MPNNPQASIEKKLITIPTGGLDGEELSRLIGLQEEMAQGQGAGSILHTNMDAPDHPNKLLIEMEYLAEGYEDATARTLISHTHTNTVSGMPELIVVGTCPESAASLIDDVEEAIQSEEGLALDIPILLNGRLLQVIPTEFAALSYFNDAFSSFIASQVLACQWGTVPKWMQIVYADENHRFPWEPGADPEAYQPVAARPGSFGGIKATGDV